MADLAIGVTACIAFWQPLPFKAAAACAASVFLLGCDRPRVPDAPCQMLAAGNFRRATQECQFYMDVICPSWIILDRLAYRRTRSFSWSRRGCVCRAAVRRASPRENRRLMFLHSAGAERPISIPAIGLDLLVRLAEPRATHPDRDRDRHAPDSCRPPSASATENFTVLKGRCSTRSSIGVFFAEVGESCPFPGASSMASAM